MENKQEIERLYKQLVGKRVKDIEQIEPIGPKVLAYIRTKNGLHMIVKPFNKSKVSFTDDIHKDNPTILFMVSNL